MLQLEQFVRPLKRTLKIMPALCVALSAFASPTYTPEASNGDGLEIGTPEALHFNEKLLAQGFDEAAKLDYSHSLLVLRDGKLVAERYFHGYSSTSPNNLHSVSKSIISALVGIALDKKILPSVDQRMAEAFPPIFAKLDDPRKSAIKLRHLLTMSAGLDICDDCPNNDGGVQLDRAEYVFSKKLTSTPGERFAYSTQYTHVIARVLAEAAQTPAREFAEKHLFGPLGVKVLGWPRDALGYYLGDMIFLTSRDMAKFGLLYLNQGEYKGKRIVSSSWVETSTSGKIAGSPGNGQYGYQWWSKLDAPVPYYYAWGYGGQYIVIAPTKKLVVVMTNDFTSKRPQDKIRAIFENYVLPAAN